MTRLMAALLVLTVIMVQSALAESEEGVLEQAMRDDAAGFQAMAEDVIAGFGGPDGLTPDGIEDHVALARAVARAEAMRRLLAIDLGNDGSVDRNELEVTQRAASAAARGRLERQFASADTNGDARIDPAEIRANGHIAALRAMSETDVELLRALITLDLGGDGAVSLQELRTALSRLDEAT
ncbi:MAG: hypothetical protein C0524_05415 [Rhodobacter sp.]|nr:hypothetical protein [Rhodobacter sp.]